MEVKYLLDLIVFFYCSTILLVASHNVSREAHFRVFHQHPGMRNCAAYVLEKDGLVGGRVSNVTGVCEGLQHSWALNQTMEEGYSYFKTVKAKQKYHPPAGIKEFAKTPSWLIPGVLHVGAEVHVTILTSWLISYPAFVVMLSSSTEIPPKGIYDGHWIQHTFGLWTRRDPSTSDPVFGVAEKDPYTGYYDEKRDSFTVRLKHSKVKKRKLTLQATTDGFKCMFDGKVIYTYQRETFDPKIMKQVYVRHITEIPEDPVVVHSFEFREHIEG